MNHRSLVQASELREVRQSDLAVPRLLPDGQRLLQSLWSAVKGQRAACVRQHSMSGDLVLGSHATGTSSWYAGQGVRVLLWDGDLHIDGDLIDDDFNLLPVLLVRGSLSMRNWLRGGMPAFVGGEVRASGFIVGHFNDSALFTGGGLAATGYLPRARPYPDFLDIRPHQFAGPIAARCLDLAEATPQALTEAFVDEVLTREPPDDDGEEAWVSVDERSVIDRFNAGLPVWR